MKQKKKLTEDEIKKISENVSRPTYGFFNRAMEKELKKILNEHDVLKYDVIHITAASIFDVYINVLLSIKSFLDENKTICLNFDDMVRVYSTALKDIVDKKILDALN